MPRLSSIKKPAKKSSAETKFDLDDDLSQGPRVFELNNEFKDKLKGLFKEPAEETDEDNTIPAEVTEPDSLEIKDKAPKKTASKVKKKSLKKPTPTATIDKTIDVNTDTTIDKLSQETSSTREPVSLGKKIYSKEATPSTIDKL